MKTLARDALYAYQAVHSAVKIAFNIFAPYGKESTIIRRMNAVVILLSFPIAL